MKKVLLFMMMVAVFLSMAKAADETGLVLTDAQATVSENFDTMWDATASAGTLTMPAGWRVDRQMNAPRMIGAYSTGATEVMYEGGVSLASNAKNGTWNFGSSTDPSDRAVGGLSTTVSGGTRCVSLMTQLTNGGTQPVNKLTFSYDIEKYRKGANAAGFTVQMYYSLDGTSWKSAGDDFKNDFTPDAETIGAEVVPISTTSVTDRQLNTAVAVGSSIYLAWNISVSSGTTPDKAMGLALDNISISASFGEPQVDPDPTDPDRPPFVSSGIFLRGEVNGWSAVTDWEFSDEGDGNYVLYDKELSGAFKVADATWSTACNYGSNGSSVTMDASYTLVAGTNDNISCGGYTYTCKRIILTLDGGASTLLLESRKSDTPDEPSVAQSVTLMPADVVLVPQLPEKVKVLSLNNSLIHYNDQPAMFNEIAAAMGSDAQWTKHTLLGKPLSTHWSEGDGLAADGNPSAKMLVRTEAWSHIILQEQSSLPRTNIEAFRSNIRQWVAYIRENCPNPNAVIIVPMNWAYSGDWTNFTNFNQQFFDNYMNVARETGVTICPVGVAYQQVYDEKGADGIAPWFQDDRHPTDISTYMAACMEYGLIFGIDPATITSHPASISDADAAEMRTYASKALAGFSNIVDHNAATVRYKAVTLDQYGREMDTPDDLVYTSSGGGQLDDSQTFTANGTEGLYTVNASNAQFNTTAKLKVTHAGTVVQTFPAIELNADQLTATEDFNTMGTDAEATLPTAWRIDRQTSAPRLVGSYAAAQDKTMYAGGASLPSNAKNGLWNFGQDDSDDRAPGGISTGVADGTRCVNLYAHFINTGRKNIGNLTISYDVEKYRKGSNAAGFTVQMYYSLDGRNWTSAGTPFCTTFTPDAATEGYATVPGEVRHVSALLDTKMQPGVDFYLAWNITVTSGDNAASAMALAIDNFQMSGELPPVPTARHYIYVIDETGYDALGLYAWGDGEIFGAWPGETWVDEKVIGGETYKVFLLDAESGSYNLIFNNWNNGLQVPDYPITPDRDYYLRVTSSGVSEQETLSISPLGGTEEGVPGVSGAIFDLQGRRVQSLPDNHLPKGIYIVGGKKLLVR